MLSRSHAHAGPVLPSSAMSATESAASYEAYALPLILPLTTGAGYQ